MSNFSQLGLSESTVKVLDQLGFTTPTEVQEQAIPILLNDKTDFIGLAQTGTGKTAAFGLPLVELIDTKDPSTQALVMAPTRELGQQIAKQLVAFSAGNKALNVEVVYGGAAIMNQMKALRKPTQLIVATPGRLLDLIKRKSVKLENIKYVILDEADEMLNMGFKEAIDEILSHTPEDKSTWLFSATMPADIRKIVKKYMTDPKEISVNHEEKSNKDIAHKFVITKASNKIPALRRFLDLQPEMRGVMFCRTRRETQQIAEELNDLGYSAEPLHGELSQQQRDAAMKRFKSRSMQLLIATDVAARGIDVNDLTHVIHHTLPDQLESYTHRSGRTGRAGKKGISLAFINPREGRKITELERRIKVKFEQVEVPEASSIQNQRLKNWAEGIVSAKPGKQSEALFEEIKEAFLDFSKEDLLKHLIASQMETITPSNNTMDLNESVGGSPERRDSGQFNRYFINIGSVDDMSKKEIIAFISEIGKIDPKFIGDLTVKPNHTFVEVDRRHDSSLAAKFRNVQLNTREIRMNRDDAKGSEVKSKRKVRPDRSSFRKKSHGPRKGRRRN